jgi:N-acetyl-anhydromuramyl-L-alanine amidase AmpD
MSRRVAAMALVMIAAGCGENAPPSTGSGGSIQPRASYASAPPPSPVHQASPTERRSYGAPYRAPYAGGNRAPQQYYRPSTGSSVPRAWVPSAPRKDWNYIVIHHSDTEKGSAASFRQYHVQQRHWNDLGYHFVIGNGNGARDGLVEVGGRWTRQEIGAHAGVLKFNEEGIGICLVGDFNRARPTNAQMQGLAKLTAYLMRTYNIPASRVIGHNTAKNGATDCPGKYLSVASVRTMASRYAHAEDPSFPVFTQLAQGELLRDVPLR